VYQPSYTDKKTRTLKTSALWWIKYPCRHTCGKADCKGTHLEATGSTKEADAVKLLRKRLGEIGQGRLIGPDVEKTRFEDLAGMIVTDYTVNARKSTERLHASLKRLREFFGQSRALAITSDRVSDYIKARQEAKAAGATIKNELAALKRMYTLGIQAGKVAQRPYIPSVEVRNTRTGFFEEEEFRAVLAHLPDDLKSLVEFLYLTGWRVGEVLPLPWRQVDFQAGEARLEPGTTKNDEGRTFPFGILPELGDLLRHQRERTTAVEKAAGQIVSHVFHRSGREIKDFRHVWEQACQRAGLPGRLVHDFRRTAVRNLERAGVPRSVAMKLTGHKTETVYRRYAIVSPADLKEGVAKLARLREALRAEPAAPSPRVVSLAERRRGDA
jgi:integrase